MAEDKLILECTQCISTCYRELWAIYLLPASTAHALTRHLSVCAFKALGTILLNAHVLLCDRFQVMSPTELSRYMVYRRELNLIAYGDSSPTDEENSESETVKHRLQIQRKTLWVMFYKIYDLLHVALANMLPFAHNTLSVGAKMGNMHLLRAWLLACALLPKNVFVVQMRRHMHAYAFKAFRELAANLLDNFFNVSTPLLKLVIDPYKTALHQLASDKPLKLLDAHVLIQDCFEALQFGCELLTRSTCLFGEIKQVEKFKSFT